MLRPSKAALYERIIDEKDTQIRILVAELDWTRAHFGVPSLPAPITTKTLPDGLPAEVTSGDWESEADEAKAILEKEGLSAVHLPEILEGLGYGNSDLG